MTKIRACVVGASGLTARELLRLLAGHPRIVPAGVTGRTKAGEMIADVFPILDGAVSLKIADTDPETVARDFDAFFLALPHTVAMDVVPTLLKSGKPLVDFSADYRLRNRDDYEKWYKTEHRDPANLGKAVYGLPELFRDQIAGAHFVANPGCYPTAAALAIAPVVDIVNLTSIVIDAKSGVSGAGVKLTEKTQYVNANENFSAYKIGEHQHTPEIVQTISDVAGRRAELLFVPHLTPMDRGIFETIYLDLETGISQAALVEKFRKFYPAEKNPFVRISETPIAVQDVNYTNRCRIHPRVVGKRLVITGAIDNLIKGAAGQALQNMNIVTGLPEEAGLC